MSAPVTNVVSSWTALALDLFVTCGVLTPDDAQSALEESATSQRLPIAILAEQAVIQGSEILNRLSRASGLGVVDLVSRPAMPDALCALPLELCREHFVVGHRFAEGSLVVVAAEPLEHHVLEVLTSASGLLIASVELGEVLQVEELIASLEEVEEDAMLAPITQITVHAPFERERVATPGASVRQGPCLDEILERAAALGASDVHLVSGAVPAVRIDGAIRPLEQEGAIAADDLASMLVAALGRSRMERFEEYGELDAAYALENVGRFRVSVFRQRGSLGSVMRLIPGAIPAFDELNLPASIASLAELRRGLVLVTGPTGSGKSTTLASIVGLINESRPLHIMTVEDPIEFEHTNKTAIVNQREVGLDTRSFADALRHVLRQDPDVILVGEMRDLETIAIALTAAETGHLVLSTLHTSDAAQTIDRVIDVFPAAQQPQIRSQLANALEGVIAQQLVIGRSGLGRVAIAEVMRCTPAVRNLIRGGKTHQLASLIQSSGEAGMQTMDLGLAKAVQAGLIAEAVAFDHAHDEDELRDHLRSGVGR